MHTLYRIQRGDIKTGSTYKIGWGNVEFGTIRAYFYVGKCSSRLGIVENLGVAVESRFYLVLSQTYQYFRFRRRHVEFCTMRAYFDVGQCSIRTGVIENLGVAVGIASLP